MTPRDKRFYQAVGQRIAERRKALNLTQVQLAEQLGIAQQTMAHYEGGSLRVSVVLLQQVINVLGVSFEELVGEPARASKKRGPSSKLQQQVEKVQQLPRAKQKFVTDMLDTVIQQQHAG